jgi:hypothetical protein
MDLDRSRNYSVNNSIQEGILDIAIVYPAGFSTYNLPIYTTIAWRGMGQKPAVPFEQVTTIFLQIILYNDLLSMIH